MAVSLAQLMYVARSGLVSQLMDLDVVSNNIANINTVGFKNYRSNFQEMVNGNLRTGTQIRATQINMTQGAVQLTTNPLNMCIQGLGFFSVKLPGGQTAYTRDGQFSEDAQGNIVNANGYPLIWQGTIPTGSEEVSVQPTGEVMSRTGNVWTQVGTIQLSNFPNPSALTTIGQNLFQATAISGAAQSAAPGTTGLGTLLGSSVEASNVNLSQEMTNMISLERAFQVSSSFFKQSDTMMDEAIHIRR